LLQWFKPGKIIRKMPSPSETKNSLDPVTEDEKDVEASDTETKKTSKKESKKKVGSSK